MLGDVDLPVSTVFFGGGTPTLLPPGDLAAILAALSRGVRARRGRRGDHRGQPRQRHHVATSTRCGRAASPGSRSACSRRSPHVLATLDRTHDPPRVPAVVEWARAAGFEQVSLDLIYGTPGESLADWEASLDAALACAPDHVSAYSLIVEDGTALARQVRRGEVADARRRRPGRQVPRRRRRDERGRARLVRGVELGHRDGGAVPAQRRLLERRQLVGRRPRCALARRRRALVERQAPGGVDRADRGRGQPRARPRDARRGDPPGGAGAARGAAGLRVCRSTPSTRPGWTRCPAWWTTGW